MHSSIRGRKGAVLGVLVGVALFCGVAVVFVFSQNDASNGGDFRDTSQQEEVSDKLVEISGDAAAAGGDASGATPATATGDYDPLPFGYDKPLSEMLRNDEGKIVDDDGHCIVAGVLYVSFGPEGESVEKMTRLLEENGFTAYKPYWHSYIDLGDVYAYCPDGVSEEEAYSILMGIEGVESVELCYVAKDDYLKMFS